MQCPFCESTDTIYKEKAGQWECQNCEQRFSSAAALVSTGKKERAEHPRCIFFSYGHDSNLELVNKFKDSLEKRGHKVWIDYKEIGTWDDWRGNITRGIHESSMAIAFLSIHSTRDPGVCKNEISIALQHFGVVYPILLEKIPQESVPLNIAHLQWPDLSNWREIQDGKVTGVDFDRFYEEKLLEIINKVEGDATRFSEEVTLLRRALNPPTFDGKFSHYLEGFVGRGWIFAAFEDWINDKPTSRVFWLKAGPGFGKTALAVHLASHHRSAVVANWFCDHQSSILKNASKAICAISFQLALRWDDFRVRLLASLGIYSGSSDTSINELENQLMQHNASELFDKLIVEPIAGLIWRENKLVIVIDALDEAVDDQGKNDLASLISTKFLQLPNWICFFITSRPDPSVVGYLKNFNPFELSSSDERNSADLKTFYQFSLAPIINKGDLSQGELEEIEEFILEKSEGMILYLRMIVDGLKEGSITLASLKSLQSGVGGLYASYYAAFQHRFAVDFIENVQPLLSLVLASPGPLPVQLAAKILGKNSSLVQRMRTQLGSYLIDEPKGLIIFHKTLSEWLADASSGHFYTDSSNGKSEIGRYLWNIFIAREINDIGLSTSFEGEEHALAWLPELLPEMPEWKSEDRMKDFASWLWEKCSWSSAEIFLNRVIEINRLKFGNSDPKTLASINHLGDFFREKREFVLATKQYLIALEECQKTLDENHPLTIECLKDYGAALSFSEDTAKEAESCLRIALARCMEVFGENHITTFQVMHYLASSISDTTEAEDLYKRALAGREKILGINHPETLMTLNNYAGILNDKGDLDGSIDAYRRAYLTKLDVLGKHHPSTLVSLSNLVMRTREKGDLIEAEAYGREVLDGYEMNFGPDHALSLDACLGLASVLEKQENYVEAEALYRRRLVGVERSDGLDSPVTLQTCFLLADVLEQKGSLDEAETLFRRILATYERINGPEHSLTLGACYDLAVFLAKKEYFDEAEALFRRELAGLERDKGADHPSTLQTCYNLARILVKKECFDEAEELFRRELAGLEKDEGSSHISKLETCSRLADVLVCKGSLDEAEVLYRRVLDAYEKDEGLDHPSTLQACYNLAALLTKKECFDEAEALYRRELAGLEKEKGADHPSTLQTCYELAGLLFKKECYDESEVLYKRELASIEKENGFNHPSTLQTYGNLAEVLLRKQCVAQAEDIYRRSLVAFEEINGPYHSSTLEVCSRLARVLVRKGCISEAIILLRKYLMGASASEDDICYLRYNLACYECLNGNLSEAKLILTEHLILHPEDFEMALNDADLIEIKEFIQKKDLV
jgi:tetratricopeptide (TPR) repeat protein